MSSKQRDAVVMMAEAANVQERKEVGFRSPGFEVSRRQEKSPIISAARAFRFARARAARHWEARPQC